MQVNLTEPFLRRRPVAEEKQERKPPVVQQTTTTVFWRALSDLIGSLYPESYVTAQILIH